MTCLFSFESQVRTRSYGEAWDVLELLLKCGRKADKYFVSILTKSLEASNDKRWVRRGISLVDKFIEQQREDVDEIVFNSLLNVLGQTGDMQKLQQTLNKMSDYGVAPSAVTFGTVVKAYGRARDTESVIKVWNQMRSRCLGINPVTCGCVLDACVKCNSLDKAMAIFQEMRMQGMHKNTVLYATLIKGLAKVRDLQGAMNLYHEMRMEGVPCNLVTFNSLMDVCVRCGDLQTAAYFLQDMMGMGIDPDLITFSTLIKGYSHIGEVHKALALSKELKARGLKCDEIMYNSLIDGCAKARKVQEGLAVFEAGTVGPKNGFEGFEGRYFWIYIYIRCFWLGGIKSWSATFAVCLMSFFFSFTCHASTWNFHGQQFLAGNVAIAGATFKHHLLHFGEASLRGINCFIKLFGAPGYPRKNGIFFAWFLRFQTLHHHLEILDIPKQRACKCTKSEGYYGSEEWMMSLLEQMCSSISRHVVSFFQLSSFSCSTGWANRWSFSLGTHPPHCAFSTETLKDSHLMIESHVIKENFTIKCCSGHELLYLTLMHGRNTS